MNQYKDPDYNKKYRKNNAAKIATQRKKYYEANKTKILEKQKSNYANSSDSKKAYYNANKAVILAKAKAVYHKKKAIKAKYKIVKLDHPDN
tara:strand:+ start:1264 stop:1536 length:273 start_codon:yes stop_codon:yes gene_type:complete